MMYVTKIWFSLANYEWNIACSLQLEDAHIIICYHELKGYMLTLYKYG